jgi:hypothetical protein
MTSRGRAGLELTVQGVVMLKLSYAAAKHAFASGVFAS